MKIPKEAICSFCKQIFCCGKCREKHEVKNHAIRIFKHFDEATGKDQLTEFIYLFCPICASRPFPLHKVIQTEMLDHIKLNHLPLHCQKCCKVYENINDLIEFTNCAPSSFDQEMPTTQAIVESSCTLEIATKSITTHQQQKTISTQTSPHLENRFNGTSSITPISMFNLQWKAKSKITNHHQNISDNSVSSIKNISSINNSTSMRRSIGSITHVVAQGKLVRTTSTPVQVSENENVKPKDQTFNASGGQVSSIYSSGCETENQNSPTKAYAGSGGSTFATHNQSEAVNLYRKFNGRTKVAAVTPLRQVMSKSIQKAFAEHCISSLSDQKPNEPNDANIAISETFSSSPLDLRLSPAIRRSQNAQHIYITTTKRSEKSTQEVEFEKFTATPKNKQTERNRISGSHLKTESIMITHTQQVSCYQSLEDQYNTNISNAVASSVSSISTNSIYKTCQSFEIITSSDAHEIGGIAEKEFSCKEKGGNDLGSQTFKYPNGNSTSIGQNIVPITPTTRLPGSSINKIKAIQFETPKGEDKSNLKTPIVENFYTPISSPPRSSEDKRARDLSLSNLVVPQKLTARFAPSCRPPIHQSNAYSQLADEINDANDEVFLEKTNIDLCHEEKQATGSGGFLKSIVKSVMRLPSLTEKANFITQRPGIHKKDTSKKASIIKRCSSIAGSLIRSTSLMDEKQLNTMKRKRTHTIDSDMYLYRSTYLLGSVSSIEDANHNDLLSTKRFRIQGRKPIERMRKTSS